MLENFSLRAEVNQDSIIVLRSRAAEGLRVDYGNTEFPILAYKVVAKARRTFWIVRATKLAKKSEGRAMNVD